MNDRREQPVYLGDGAYVRWDEYGAVVLYTSDGLKETNTVVLEPEVLRNFVEWLEWSRTTPAQGEEDERG